MVLRNRSVSPLRGLAAVVVAALIPAVAGCEAGNNAPTQQWHQPTAGATAAVRDSAIRVSNMFVLGPTPDAVFLPGDSAGLFFAVSNSGAPDRLVSASAPGTAASVRLPGDGVALPTQQTVLLTGPEPQVILENLTRDLRGGQDVKLVLDFQRAGQLTVLVPVMPKAQYYATFSPAPAGPSPSPSGGTGSTAPSPAG